MNNKFRVLAAAAVWSIPGIALADGNGAAMTVYKNPWCGCCQVWVEAMKAEGYNVTVKDVENLDAVKKSAGVPEDMAACHTAQLSHNGRTYVIEGHVPLQAMNKLMTERPDISGIAVPGMPAGSLGMNYDQNARYDVYSLNDGGGRPEVFYEAGR